MINTEIEKKLPFEDRIDFVRVQIAKRRNKWTLSTLDWDDVEQIILTRAWKKYHTFDPNKGKFEHWLNRLISYAIKNLLRDNLYKYARPCISSGPSGGACVKNTGGNGCSWTLSQTQCAECPLFARWQKKKQGQFYIKEALSIESHVQEMSNMIHEHIDIESAKQVIDREMPNKLNEFEWKVYKMLHIDNMEEEDVGKKLKYKKSQNSKTPGYQMIRTLKKKFVLVSREIISEFGLVD